MKRIEDRRRVIGQNIKLHREKRNMSQTQLARLLWIDRTSLSGYEIGKRIPDIFMLWKMADVFDVSLDVLVGRKRD
ncbi:MAG: helix-turn-helix transcriptional regulator [Eubacteriales bacterium]|nr:helix-turn-helix transcriptional regulator [Eubacteriales bacterium]